MQDMVALPKYRFLAIDLRSNLEFSSQMRAVNKLDLERNLEILYGDKVVMISAKRLTDH